MTENIRPEFVDCAAREVLNLMIGKFSLEILVQIFYKTNHYSQLLHTVPGINSRILAKRLHEFEDAGLIRRIVLVPEPPMSIRYDLTEKGIALRQIFVMMAD